MVTLGFALLLATGFFVAKICQRFHLPSVTGYILAGVLLGPSGFNLINSHSVGSNLDHFTNIALMLISFGIGEHVELKKLQEQIRTVAWVAACEAVGAFVFVFSAVFLTIHFTGLGGDGWRLHNSIALSLLLAAVGLATAPAATLMVVREVKASGAFTASLLAIVAIDNGLAIMIFGFVIAFVQQIIGHSVESFSYVLLNGFASIAQSLFLGVFTGITLDVVLRNLKRKEERMTGGLALLLLCSELATYLDLSSLLAGMAAGFILVNRAERDVRLFRALNNFEPPIYVIFFTLAGTHLDIRALGAAGILGGIYFLARISGKISGVALGARIAGAPKEIGRYLGMGLVPQAGVAIGLLFLIAADPALGEYSAMITPVVLAGVFLSELLGPSTTRFALGKVGEAHALNEEIEKEENGMSAEEDDLHLRSAAGVEIVPWTWEKLTPQIPSNGIVAFGSAHHVTVTGLARFATMFAHCMRCLPMSVRIIEPGSDIPPQLFHKELKEVASMGYPMVSEAVPDHSIASGLVAAVEYNSAKMVVLGYPLPDSKDGFEEVLGAVIDNVSCPVIVVRFFGQLHTERILVPVVSLADLEEVYPVVAALSCIGEHQMELLYLLSSGEADTVLAAREEELNNWIAKQDRNVNLAVTVLATDARVEAVRTEAENYDLVVMGATRTKAIRRFFFGCLAETMIKKVQKNMIIVYMPGEKE